MTQKATTFEWGTEKEKALQQVPDAVHTAQPLGPYEPADPVVLKVAVASRDAAWSLGQVPTPHDLVQTLPPPSTTATSLL